MACGTPVVAFSRGSMPEIISNGENGFLVSSVDEAVSQLRFINKLDRGRCRKWVEERFTVDRMVDEYLRVYHQILTEHGQEGMAPRVSATH